MTAAGTVPEGLDARKAAIRGVLADLAALAERAGLAYVARDIRDTRLPKLDDERFTVVVLGEFNHGKSTFINALLGAPVMPTGITPTTAVLAHVMHGPRATATLVGDDGARKAIAGDRARRLAHRRRAGATRARATARAPPFTTSS